MSNHGKPLRKGSKNVAPAIVQENIIAGEAVDSPFFIAGLGGSAGGFEAFEEFFHELPVKTGIAYVLIMHLDPSKKGSLPELIQRFTGIPVLQAGNNMKVEPDHVYVIPPDKDLSIKNGMLKLQKGPTSHVPRMPIDFFLRSLGADQKEMSIGIIFSGMGTDGTLGLKAIKENMGLIMVQDPSDAKFDSMPKSAINTGLVDYIAPTKELPKHLIGYTRITHTMHKTPETMTKATSMFDKIFILIRRRTGYDFSVYKKNTIYRRIERRMGIHQITDLSGYVKYLQENTGEIDLLFKELLIGVTDFFRDPDAFEALKAELKKTLEDKPEEEVIRAWVPGCSTGEEAYSIAIIIKECLGMRSNKVQIFATDIDSDAIEIARKGVYPDSIASDISHVRIKQFFTKEGSSYKVKKEIRDMVVFAVQDLITNPPFTNMELVSCRNLLIYLTTETQQKVLSIFSYSLNSGGILFLGLSESIGARSDAYLTVDTRSKIFKRKEYVSKHEIMTSIPTLTYNPVEKAGEKNKKPAINITDQAQRAILENFSPPAVLVSENGNIFYINGHIGKYLEPAPGKATMNIFSMAHKELRNDIGIAIDKAIRNKGRITIKGVTYNEDKQRLMANIIVQPITGPESSQDMFLVAFEDVESPRIAKGRRAKDELPDDQRRMLEEQLEYARQRLQTIEEEMQTSQEEMKSINEELQSTNEELQSTNEELTTSKEELQSLNEELSTVNAELQSKNEILTRESNDMRNLLNSTEIATIFLNYKLNITRFTPEVAKIVNLKAADIGRPITDISTKLVNEEIAADASKVIESLIPVTKEVTTKDGLTYSMKIIPYRTVDNVIYGVVITFNDITNLKKLEKSMLEARDNAESARDYAEGIIETIREPLVVLDSAQKVVSANMAFYETFRVSPEETTGRSFFSLGNGQWNIPGLKAQLKEVLPKKNEVRDYKMSHDFPNIGKLTLVLNARKILEKSGRALILLAIEDMKEKDCD